jgi:hypothetical protein
MAHEFQVHLLEAALSNTRHAGQTRSQNSLGSIAFINGLPVRSDDADLLAAVASKLYRQSHEAMLFFF